MEEGGRIWGMIFDIGGRKENNLIWKERDASYEIDDNEKKNE